MQNLLATKTINEFQRITEERKHVLIGRKLEKVAFTLNAE
jgi:hypothetical protein